MQPHPVNLPGTPGATGVSFSLAIVASIEMVALLPDGGTS
jgi:hypothetical protein